MITNRIVSNTTHIPTKKKKKKKHKAHHSFFPILFPTKQFNNRTTRPIYLSIHPSTHPSIHPSLQTSLLHGTFSSLHVLLPELHRLVLQLRSIGTREEGRLPFTPVLISTSGYRFFRTSRSKQAFVSFRRNAAINSTLFQSSRRANSSVRFINSASL